MPKLTGEIEGCRVELDWETGQVEAFSSDKRLGGSTGPNALDRVKEMIAEREKILSERGEWKDKQNQATKKK